MATNHSLIKTILVGMVLILYLTSCPGPVSCPDATYQFNTSINFMPEKDSIHLGDTIYLASSFPTKLVDTISGLEIDYINAQNVAGNVYIQELPTDGSTIKGAVSSFTFQSLKGRIYNDATVPIPENVSQLVYGQLNSKYELLIGFVAKKKGVFCLTVGNGFSAGRPNHDCDKASFDIHLVNTDQHLHYLASYLGNASITPYSAEKGYCFKVY